MVKQLSELEKDILIKELQEDLPQAQKTPKIVNHREHLMQIYTRAAENGQSLGLTRDKIAELFAD